MSFSEGFELWRELGQTGAGSTISLPALTAIHCGAPHVAFVVFAVLGVAAWRLTASAPQCSAARTAAGGLLGCCCGNWSPD